MSLDAILAKIEEDARSRAEALTEAAQKEKRTALHATSADIKERHHRDVEKLKAAREARLTRMSHHLAMEMERALLSHRRNLVDAAVDSAVAEIALAKDYPALIQRLLLKCDFTGKVQVITNRKDRAFITGKFLEGVSGEKTEFVLAEETHSDHGGVILRSGDISLNATLSMIAELHHEEMVMELSRLLPLKEQGE
jgi:vacuolar-type H+-ATPase subunit E/Vma4